MTHDYVRHGTTTLFAALDIATGAVFTECKPRHRHQEFLSFLRRLDDSIPGDFLSTARIPFAGCIVVTHFKESLKQLLWMRFAMFPLCPLVNVQPGINRRHPPKSSARTAPVR